jgi:glucose-6-phosphate 1-dehydrogenase
MTCSSVFVLQNQLRPFLTAGTEDSLSEFLGMLSYRSGSYDSHESFARLSDELEVLENRVCSTGVSNRVFYLAVPPSVFVDAVTSIKASAMSETGWTRVVVEKPFGRDSESSRALSVALSRQLTEDQVRTGTLGVLYPFTDGGCVGCRPDLPHRPLPGQGNGAEPADPTLFQRNV